MDYKVKERYFEKVVEIKQATDDMDEQQLDQYISSRLNSDDDFVKFILSGYLHAIEDGAKVAKVELDMTYDTLPDVMRAIIAMANLQYYHGYDNRENAELTMKTLAAYLTLMAVNNHGAKIQVNRRGSKGGNKVPELWGYRYYLRINNKRESDFLPYAIEGLDSTPIEVDNGFAVDVNPLIGAYLRITNENLANHGFSNLVITFDEVTEKE